MSEFAKATADFLVVLANHVEAVECLIGVIAVWNVALTLWVCVLFTKLGKSK